MNDVHYCFNLLFRATIGLVIPLYRDTTIKLDGDG